MMVVAKLWALICSALTVSAFTDTSPFLIFSSSEILFPSSQFSLASSLLEAISSELSKCESDVYVVVHQPGVTVEDYNELNSSPHLKQWFSGEKKWVRSSGHVAEVKGSISPEDLVNKLEEGCGASKQNIDFPSGALWDYKSSDTKNPQIARIDLPSPPPSRDSRVHALRKNDGFLDVFLGSLQEVPKVTVLYTTTSPSDQASLHVEQPKAYEMDDSVSSLHQDLKRDVSFQPRADKDNVTLVDGPLFERYQYLTPGIFMGLLTMFLLLSIGFVGVSALQSLQVSYAAFDKENGPAAQKKQQ